MTRAWLWILAGACALAACDRQKSADAPATTVPATSRASTADSSGLGVNADMTPGTGLTGGLGRAGSGLGMTGTFPNGTATQSVGAGPEGAADLKAPRSVGNR